MKMLLTVLTISALSASAQQNDEEIKAPVKRLFDGMRTKDTALIRAALAPDAILQSVAQNKEGVVTVRTENFEDFIRSIAKAGPEVLDERIEFATINRDGNLAAVWTPYRFYVGDRFNHCGANSFQLVRLGTEWKIQYVIDTRRRDCGQD